MIYGVFGGCYSDWYIVGYFTNRYDADKYCCLCGNGDYYVKPLKNLTDEKDLNGSNIYLIKDIALLIVGNKRIREQ